MNLCFHILFILFFSCQGIAQNSCVSFFSSQEKFEKTVNKKYFDSFSKIIFIENYFLFKGHLFENGYYASNRFKFEGDDLLKKDYMRKQPFWEWNTENKIFSKQQEQASFKIKELLPNKLTLYRGLSLTEYKLIKKLQETIKNLSNEDASIEIEKFYSKQHDIFTSPNKSALQFWTKNFGADGFKKKKLTFEIDIETLVPNEDIYLGFEVNYIEIAFISTKAKIALIKSALF